MERDQPTTLLQAARLAVGWKQSRVLTVLAAVAKRDGINIATPQSLKTMLSRWENGNGNPDELYQRLLCQVYERDADELGFGAVTHSSYGLAPALNVETVEYFSVVF